MWLFYLLAVGQHVERGLSLCYHFCAKISGYLAQMVEVCEFTSRGPRLVLSPDAQSSSALSKMLAWPTSNVCVIFCGLIHIENNSIFLFPLVTPITEMEAVCAVDLKAVGSNPTDDPYMVEEIYTYVVKLM